MQKQFLSLGFIYYTNLSTLNIKEYYVNTTDMHKP